MLSLPDFKEKQILFIRAGDIEVDKIKFANDNICLTKDGKIENQISCHRVLAFFILGDCSLTSVLIRNCRKYGTSIFLMTGNFQTYARILSQAEGNYLVRAKQYATDGGKELEMAKKLVANKIDNQIFLIKKAGELDQEKYLLDLRSKIAAVGKDKDLLGLEGSASKIFFQSYFDSLDWRRRQPRARMDITNLLMDIGYNLLFNFVDGLLGIYGFDDYKGFYHKLFFQRKSLSCDIMEPFRCIIDKQIIKSYNLGQIKEEDFKRGKSGYEIRIDCRNKYLEIFAQAIMDRKEDVFCYVRDFYYFVMNDSDFPVFKME
jgi:CRISPR-associated protein Cas1